MPNVRGGQECRTGTVRPDAPVLFHQHNHGHWLTCCLDIIDVETEHNGRIRMLPGDVRWVEAHEMHKLTAPAGPAKYSCVGLEGM
jgi:hypothetical protein